MSRGGLLCWGWLFCGLACLPIGKAQPLLIPKLVQPPQIDGDLTEWRDQAFHDGLWDLSRVRHAPWYDPARNRLTRHGADDHPHDDLSARYYMAWDDSALYLGAEVWDNVIDVTDPKPAPKRWYYKDAVAWFIELPRDTIPETFGEGDHGFAFVADTTYPREGAWWRHGTADTSYLEEPLPPEAVRYRLGLPGAPGPTYVIEARLDLRLLCSHSPAEGDRLGLMIVHCDPDGGDYGGHLLIYGQNDLDSTWYEAELAPPQAAPLRRERR